MRFCQRYARIPKEGIVRDGVDVPQSDTLNGTQGDIHDVPQNVKLTTLTIKIITLLNDNETKDKYCNPVGGAGGSTLRRQHAGVENATVGGAADDGGGVPLPRCGHRDGRDDNRAAHQPPTADGTTARTERRALRRGDGGA